VSSWKILSAILLAGGLGHVARAEQQTAHPAAGQQPGVIFRAATSIVAINVTVTDGNAFVRGLSREAFLVREDGVPQEVTFFESSEVPLDLILLIDASSSMRPWMDTVHDAASGFMRVLRAGDRGAIVAFNERVRVMQDLTSDPQAIAEAIDATEAGGSTALYTALYVSLKEFGNRTLAAGEVRRQAIAVLSDGEDTKSVVPFDAVITLARRMGVTVYPISLRDDVRSGPVTVVDSSAAHALRQLARETGARAFFPAGVHQLESVYGEIAEELAAQNSIGYLPSDPRPDGRFRTIQVSIPTHPEFSPRTRTGYTAARTIPAGF
jgi:VWFA-related protein